ncbi:MAG: glycosyltransferase [Burkholderiaceae bacterium]
MRATRAEAAIGPSPARGSHRHRASSRGIARDGSRAHLAYVVHSLNPGGTERLALEMARTFSRSARVSVLCLDEPGVWAAKARAAGVAVQCLWRQPGIDLVCAARIAAFCRREAVDLIHAHQATPWFYSALARWRVRRPRLLFHEHGRFYPERYSAKKVWMNRLLILPNTHRVSAVSDDVRQRLARYEGVPPARTRVILNGTSAEPELAPTHRAAWRASLGFGPEHRVIGTVGRLDPIKNLPLWIKAFGIAVARMPALRGVIVGDGPEREAVVAQIRRQGLQHHIRLTGHRDDARQMTGIFDVFALASRSEGVSMAILDALAAAVPVVATAVGGTPEIMTSASQGWLVPDDDVEAFANALLDAARDGDAARAIGRAGQMRYREAFTYHAMIAHYGDLYAEMLGLEQTLNPLRGPGDLRR